MCICHINAQPYRHFFQFDVSKTEIIHLDSRTSVGRSHLCQSSCPGLPPPLRPRARRTRGSPAAPFALATATAFAALNRSAVYFYTSYLKNCSSLLMSVAFNFQFIWNTRNLFFKCKGKHTFAAVSDRHRLQNPLLKHFM